MGSLPVVPASTLASQVVPEKMVCRLASDASTAPRSPFPLLMVELRLNMNTIGAAPTLTTSCAGIDSFVKGSWPLMLKASGLAVAMGALSTPLWIGVPTSADRPAPNAGQVPDELLA